MSRLRYLLEALRGVAHGEPSPRGWRRLVSLCQELRGEERGVALEYLRPLLERWPDALRYLTHRDWLRHEAPPVIWPLVASLRLRAVQGAGLDKLQRWCDAGALRHLHMTALALEDHRRLERVLPRATLRWLELRGCGLSDERLAHALGGVRVDAWPLLERLDLSYNNLHGEYFVNLNGWLPALRWLDVGHNPLTPEGLEALAAQGHRRLEALHLRGVVVNIDTFEALVEGPSPALRVLATEQPLMLPSQEARWAAYQPPQPEAIYEDDRAGELDIDLRQGRLDAARRLHLGYATPQAQWEAVCARPLPQLEALELLSTRLDAAAIGRLGDAPWASQLKALWIEYRHQAQGELDWTRLEPALESLEELSLSQRRPRALLRSLGASDRLRALWSLWCQVTEADEEELELFTAAALRLGIERLSLHLPYRAQSSPRSLRLEGVALLEPSYGAPGAPRLKPRRRGLLPGRMWRHAVQGWEARLPLLERHAPLSLLLPAEALTVEVAQALASLRLPRLQTLRLVSEGLSWGRRPQPEALALLLGSGWGLGLRRLELRGLALDGAQAEALSAWRPARLEEAVLQIKALDEGVAPALQRAPWLAAPELRLTATPLRKKRLS